MVKNFRCYRTRWKIYKLEQRISKLGQAKTRVLFEPHLLLSIAATVGKPVVNYVKTGVHDGFLIFLAPRFDQEFLFQWLDMFRPQWQKYGQPGSQVNLNSDIVKNQAISLPFLPEQTAIGSLFQDIDQLISLQQRKLEVLKEQKKTYLKLLFPSKGQTKPALRFAGFEDEWKEVKLGEIADYKNGKGYEDRQSDSGSYELINLNSISIDGGLKRSGKFIDKADETLEKGDLVMVLSDVAHGNLLGRVAIIPESNKFVLNQRVALLRPRLNSNSEFLYSYINSNQYYFKAQGAGMSQLNISRSSVENFSVYFPSLPEQEVIGSFFQDLDKAIAKQEEKVSQLKESKQTLLRKMFI